MRRSGAPFGDSVFFVLAGLFKGSQLGDYYFSLIALLEDLVMIRTCVMIQRPFMGNLLRCGDYEYFFVVD